ncbi:hypothetical protein IGI95_002724 [Enterococcus sp. DIV0784]|uniref:YhgE/Pip domain-containing protein n=1 Tax=unclassified Enterococcus TaxID=2608891 RepID=UPI003F22D107
MKRKFILGFVLLFLASIPMLYSTLFLGASMNPYENLNKLPVAIVNNRENVIAKGLTESNLFDFKEEKDINLANKDLENGKVFAVISFDEDVQENIIHFPKTKKEVSINLTISEGLNYFSSKVITSAMNKFVEQTNAKLSNTLITKMKGVNIPDNVGSIVQLNTRNIHPVKNNGEAMAPYLFSLTLFVGGIFVNQFVMRNLKRREKSFTSYWTRQFLIPLCIGVFQVVLLIIGNQLFIHIPINSNYQLFVFLCLTCATFSSIIVGFNKLIPGIGSLVVLLLTMLQTSSAAGVYPIILTDNIFKVINACIPMTYSIKGLKSIISLDSFGLIDHVYPLIGFFIFGQILILLAYFIHDKKKLNNF